MDKMIALVTFANPWAMLDERTGTQRTGITVEYLLIDTLKPVINDDGSKGVRHCKESIDSDKISKISSVPGWYELQFAMKPGSKGKPVLKLDNIHFVDDYSKK